MPLSILHISDLHVSPNFFAPSPGFAKRHDPDLFAAMAGYWKSKAADYVVATGDISTDGETQSLANAKTFLLDGLQPPGATAKIGLGVQDNRLFLVPGNHDRYAG